MHAGPVEGFSVVRDVVIGVRQRPGEAPGLQRDDLVAGTFVQVPGRLVGQQWRGAARWPGWWSAPGSGGAAAALNISRSREKNRAGFLQLRC
jgi:hypothetical protein